MFRILCLDRNEVGTGFLHKSGNLLTAAQVVSGCANLQMVLANGTISPVTVFATDQDYDLAILKPAATVSAKPLEIAPANDIKVGTQVSTWGFPAGYNGLSPLLSVGYLAGIDAYKMASGNIVKKWVVNAAFNGGNSGGPLIQIETGAVFGVVSSKLAPISPQTAEIVKVLEQQKYGQQYTWSGSDGTKLDFSEAQLVSLVLNELRRQVQLVIGQAVLREDLIAFLKANSMDP